MLPNRFNLYKTTEDQLRRFKQKSGLTPNVAARLAFFQSVADSFHHSDDDINADGALNLDKATWLGPHAPLIEMLLVSQYDTRDGHRLERAWAAHVSAGLHFTNSISGHLRDSCG